MMKVGKRGSSSAVTPFAPGDATVGGAPEVDAEMGGLQPAVYDEQAWSTGETMRQSAAFTEEDYVPAVMARQRLQAVVRDMDAMRKDHHAMMVEVRKNYETIADETKVYYTQYIGDLGERYNDRLAGLKRETDEAVAEATLALAVEMSLAEEHSATDEELDMQ